MTETVGEGVSGLAAPSGTVVTMQWDWQPIASAPRDGRWILAAAVGARPYIVQWCEAPAFGWSDWFDGEYRVRKPVLTHWLPLPDLVK